MEDMLVIATEKKGRNKKKIILFPFIKTESKANQLGETGSDIVASISFSR